MSQNVDEGLSFYFMSKTVTFVIFFKHLFLHKGFIPPGVVFVLRWQSSPTQVKCASTANNFTYILNGFVSEMRIIWGTVS